MPSVATAAPSTDDVHRAAALGGQPRRRRQRPRPARCRVRAAGGRCRPAPRTPCHRPSAPRPGQRAHVGGARGVEAVAGGLGARRPGRPGARIAIRRRRRPAARRRRCPAACSMTLDDRRLAVGERAGLVERHRAHAGQPLEVRAALDEHAAPGGGGERGDDRHRRGDHQRARARDHQQHQRAVGPQRRPAAPSDGDRHDEHRGRHRDHRRRVPAGEAIDELLRRRALRLRRLDQVHDAGERRVAHGAGDADVERAAGR